MLEKLYCTGRANPAPAQSPRRMRGRGYTGNSREVKCVRLDVTSRDVSYEDKGSPCHCNTRNVGAGEKEVCEASKIVCSIRGPVL